MPLFRYYHPTATDHFYTTSWDEGCNAVANLGYKYEGVACYVAPTQDPQTVPVHRLFAAGAGHCDHFYTISKPEADAAMGGNTGVSKVNEIKSKALHRLYGLGGKHHFYTTNQAESDTVRRWPGIAYEGVIGYLATVAKPGTTPMFRLYHRKSGDHFYTTSRPERDQCLAGGWNNEGELGYVCTTKQLWTTELYRLYHPRLGSHFYTTNRAERDRCVQAAGWRDEGIAGYIWTFPGYDYEGLQCYIGESQLPGTVKLLRAFHPHTGDHFYTTAQAEMDDATQKWGYIAEGHAGYVWSQGKLEGEPVKRKRVPWHRRWNGKDHFYTMHPDEAALVLSQHYQDEGSAGFVEDERQARSPLYRLYLAKNGDHFYTTSEKERDYSRSVGYLFEGVACYVAAGAGAGTARLLRSYNNHGKLTTDRKTYVDTGRYHITFLRHTENPSFIWGEVTITDTQTKTNVRAWGDPHLHTSDGDKMQFQETISIDLEDGSKVTIKTTPKNAQGIALVEGFMVIRPPEGVMVTGLSGPKLDAGAVTQRWQELDNLWGDGTVLRAKGNVADLVVASSGQEMRGGDARQQFGEIMLDGRGGASGLGNTHEKAVKATYRLILEREGEPAGVAGWIQYLDRGRSERDMVREFCYSAEFRDRFANKLSPADLATMLYRKLLLREPENRAVVDGWASVIRTRGYKVAVDGFLASAEYQARFGVGRPIDAKSHGKDGGDEFGWFPGDRIGDHFYTISQPEHQAAIPKGWEDEGLACHIFTVEEKP